MNLAPVSLLLFTFCLLVTNPKPPPLPEPHPIEGGHLPPPPSSLLRHLYEFPISCIENAALLSSTFWLLAIYRNFTVVVAVLLQGLAGIQWLQAHFSAREWVAMIWNWVMVYYRLGLGLGKTRKTKMMIAIIMGLLLILASYVLLQQQKEKERIEMDEGISVNWMLQGSNPQHYGFCHGIDCPNLWSNHTIGCRLPRFSASYLINSLQGSRLIFVNQTNHRNILQREQQNLTPSAFNAFKFSVYLSIQLSHANPIYTAVTLDSETGGLFIVAWRRRPRMTIEELAEEFPDILVEVPLSIFEELLLFEETASGFFCPFIKDTIWCLC